MRLNHTHILAAGLTAAALAVTLLGTGVQAQEMADDSTSAATVTAGIDVRPGRSALPPPALFTGNPGCYWVWGVCGNLVCPSNWPGRARYDFPCQPGQICAGGMVFQKGSTATTYGPWYIIDPMGETGTYQRLKVRFNSSVLWPQTIASYNPSQGTVPGTWTIGAGNGTVFQAQVVYSHSYDCW